MASVVVCCWFMLQLFCVFMCVFMCVLCVYFGVPLVTPSLLHFILLALVFVCSGSFIVLWWTMEEERDRERRMKMMREMNRRKKIEMKLEDSRSEEKRIWNEKRSIGGREMLEEEEGEKCGKFCVYSVFMYVVCFSVW